LQYSVHPAWLRPSSQEIYNEYAAQTMFGQSQAYPTENKPKKPDFSGFFHFQKSQRC